MTSKEFSNIALSFPGTVDAPHFDRIAFKVVNKRIFATIHEASNTVNIKLSPADQKDICEHYKKAVYPVPNKWGLQGWTTFELKEASRELIFEALDAAYKLIVTVK